MADADQAYQDLEDMLKEFRKDPYGKFKDDRMVWLVTMWIKVAVEAKGIGMFAPLKLQFLKKGKPGKASTTDPKWTWRQEAYADLKAFEGAMSRNKDNPDPHKLDDATNAMVAFAQEFRNQYTPDSTKDKAFDNLLRVKILNLQRDMGGE